MEDAAPDISFDLRRETLLAWEYTKVTILQRAPGALVKIVQKREGSGFSGWHHYSTELSVPNIETLRKEVARLNARLREPSRGRPLARVRWPHRLPFQNRDGRFLGSIHSIRSGRFRRALSFVHAPLGDSTLLELSDASGDPSCFYVPTEFLSKLVAAIR